MVARPRRQNCPPWGLNGGLPGEPGVKMLKKPGDRDFVSVDISRHLVPAESEVVINAGSGGGWGDPLEREPEQVRWDVIEGLVTPDAAKARYGVVLKGEDIDLAATTSLRREMTAARSR